MKLSNLLRTRLGAIAFSAVFLAPAPARHPIEVTANDVAASNQKIASAYGALVTMWDGNFKQINERFDAPRIARYRGTVMTSCGVIAANNAEYCPRNNTIFYDEVFVAGMAKSASETLRTDGDMTGIGIIAHETGHAVAMQLGHRYRSSYDNESTADCLAGAFAFQAKRDKTLEDGDMEEALLGMEMSGDPEPEPTGNRRYDRAVARQIASQSHGTKEQRVENFQDGFRGGPGACLEEFRSLR